MNWTHTIDTGAASPQRPHTPPEAAGLRLVLAERPGERFDDDEPQYVDPCYADPAEVERTIAAQAAELDQLRARVAELEAEMDKHRPTHIAESW